MKDFKNDSTTALSRFGRDKRTRVTSQTAERVERRPQRNDYNDNEHYRSSSYGHYNSDGSAEGRRPQKRASYNPNFTEDNRPVSESRRNHSYGEHRSSYGSSNSGSRPAYGEQRGASKPHSQNRYGTPSRSYGDERYGNGGEGRKYSQNRHQGKPAQRRYYDENGDIDGNRIDANDPAYNYAPSRPHRDSKPHAAKPYGRPAGGHDARPVRKGAKDGKPAGHGRQRRDDDRPKAYPKYSPERHPGEVRLNRFIAQSGVCSRREADDFITAGLVTVNGEVVTALGTKVQPEDDVRFNGERIQGEHKVYLVLNKPKGYVTSLDDPHADKTVMELVKGACSERIYPVGRLDKNSVGLLLFTNDGDITRRLTHPSLNKKKVYQVSLDKPLTNADMQAIADGIMLDDGEIHADEIACVKDDRKEVGIEIHSGRNRVVRRIFEHLGYKVQKLDRVYYAGLTKKNLKRGAWRFLTDAEVAHLKSGQYE